MYTETPMGEELHLVKQDLLDEMAGRYMPMIRICQSGNGFDDGILELLNGDISDRGIERHIRNMLYREIVSIGVHDLYFRNKDFKVRQQLKVNVDTCEIYLDLRKEYLDLLTWGGLDAFMKGLGPNDIHPVDRGISLRPNNINPTTCGISLPNILYL